MPFTIEYENYIIIDHEKVTGGAVTDCRLIGAINERHLVTIRFYAIFNIGCVAYSGFCKNDGASKLAVVKPSIKARIATMPTAKKRFSS